MWRFYNKVLCDHATVEDEFILAIPIKAINDCTGPTGLCPSLLAFGNTPQIPNTSRDDQKSQVDLIRAAQKARIEYKKIACAESVKLAARKPAPAATEVY